MVTANHCMRNGKDMKVIIEESKSMNTKCLNIMYLRLFGIDCSVNCSEDMYHGIDYSMTIQKAILDSSYDTTMK